MKLTFYILSMERWSSRQSVWCALFYILSMERWSSRQSVWCALFGVENCSHSL